MSQSKAVRSGFAAIFKSPLVYLGELAWRWTFSLTAAALSAYGVLLYFDSLPVSDRQLLLLSDWVRWLVPSLYAETLASIFRGSGPTLLRMTLALSLGLGALWVFAASMGRMATLRGLATRPRGSLRTVVQSHILRFAVGFTSLVAFAGAVVLAADLSRTGPGGATDSDTYYAIFLPVALLISLASSTLSWYLQVAPVAAVRNDTGLVDSLLELTHITRRRGRQFAWVGFVFGAFRVALWWTGFVVFLFTLGMLAEAPVAVIYMGLTVVAASCSSVSILLSLSRMAAYSRILEWDEEERRRARMRPAASAPPATQPTPLLPDTGPYPLLH